MTPYDALRQTLIEHIGIEPDDITPASVLADLGLDSLDRVEVALEVENLTGCTTTDEAIENAVTVAAFAAAFTKEAA